MDEKIKINLKKNVVNVDFHVAQYAKIVEDLKGEITALKERINQLENENIHSKLISEKGIIYAPDFLINAGGLINVYSELKGYNRDNALEKTRNIYDTTLEIFYKSEKEGITTHEAAFKIAKQRIEDKKKQV